jgi:hypothetical protein
LAKAKAKAAVKKKPAKAPSRAVAAAKPAATKPVKASAAKAVKSAVAKTAVKPATRIGEKVADKPSRKPPVTAAPRTTAQLSLPAAKQAETPVAKPQLAAPKPAAGLASRADLPPADGFTLLVDGHFKSRFDDLKGAKAAASELKGRFPMLRVEIYDASKKTRLPA